MNTRACVLRACLLVVAATLTLGVGSRAIGQSTAWPVEHPVREHDLPVVQLASASNSSNMARLGSRVRALEMALADTDKVANTASKDDVSKGTDVSAEKFNYKLTGRVYGDTVLVPGQNAASELLYGNLDNYYEFRSVRLGVSGTGYGVYNYKVEMDFAGTHPALKSAYLGMQDVPRLGYVRFGHFKGPFSLEELTSSKYGTFMERSMPTHTFSPGYNVGAAFHDHSEAKDLTWGAGLFATGISNSSKEHVDDNQGLGFSTRGTWNPYYAAEGRGLLHLGLGYHFRDLADDQLAFGARPGFHNAVATGGIAGGLGEKDFISVGSPAAHDYSTFNAEMAVVRGPSSVQGQVFYTRANAISASDMGFLGAYVQGSYFLTGEHRPYDRTHGTFSRVTPFENFWCVRTPDGRSNGRGAWEVAARWSYVDLTDGAPYTLAGPLHDLTLGVNWYWNSHTRMMLNYVHAIGMDDAAADMLGARMQFDF